MTEELEQLLADRGALMRGHFQFASGRHGDTYVEKFRILQWPDITSGLCERIAAAFSGAANVVAGPTTGGVILSFETARQLGLKAIIAERREDGAAGREFRRGFEIGPGDRVLVVTYDAKPPYSHKIVKVKDLPPDELARFQATLARDAERVAKKAEQAVRDGQVVDASEKKQGDQSPN